MIMKIGPAMPDWASVGNSPIRTVDGPKIGNVKTSIFLRPIRSPYRQATMTPSERKRKLIPMVAGKVMVAKPRSSFSLRDVRYFGD